MERWSAERLPAHFTPRRGRAGRSALRRVCCSVAVAVAVLVLSAVAYAQSQAAARVPMVVQLLLGTSIRLTPAPPPAQQVRPPPSRVTTSPRPGSAPQQPVVAATPETIDSGPAPTAPANPPASPSPPPPPPPVAATTTTSGARQQPQMDAPPLLVCLPSLAQHPSDQSRRDRGDHHDGRDNEESDRRPHSGDR
jgi:hypothetical protein